MYELRAYFHPVYCPKLGFFGKKGRFLLRKTSKNGDFFEKFFRYSFAFPFII